MPLLLVLLAILVVGGYALLDALSLRHPASFARLAGDDIRPVMQFPWIRARLSGRAVEVYDTAVLLSRAAGEGDRTEVQARLDLPRIVQAWFDACYSDPRTAEEYQWRASIVGEPVASDRHDAEWVKTRQSFQMQAEQLAFDSGSVRGYGVTLTYDLPPQSRSARTATFYGSTALIYGSVRSVRLKGDLAYVTVRREFGRAYQYVMEDQGSQGWRVVRLPFYVEE